MGSDPTSELTVCGLNCHFLKAYYVLSMSIIFLNLQNNPVRSVVLAPFYR